MVRVSGRLLAKFVKTTRKKVLVVLSLFVEKMS